MEDPKKVPHGDSVLPNTPTEVTPSSAQPTQQPESTLKKRRSRPLLVVLLSLLLVAVGAASALYVYKSMFEKPDQIAVTVESSNLEETIDANSAIETVKSVFKGKSTTIDPPILATQVVGYEYNTSLVGTDGYIGVSGDIPAADNAVKMAEIGKALKAKSFTEKIESAIGETNYTARYFGASALCYVTSAGSWENPSADYAVQVACANMSTFKDVAALQKPLYEAAKSEQDIDKDMALYGKPVEKASKTAGYTTATLVLGVANAGAGASQMYFYQSPDKAWHFVTKRGDIGPGPQCSEFATDDAKKAYAGEQCYNDETASKI